MILNPFVFPLEAGLEFLLGLRRYYLGVVTVPHFITNLLKPV
jgi:hypothetical protein